MLKNTGPEIRLFTTIQAIDNEVSSAGGFELLCTYNWIEKTKDKSDPAIYVPGGPPKWKPPTLPITLSLDAGMQYVDQNAFRIPKYPFEPVFWALDLMNPNMRFNDVDLVCNRNSLRKLLDIAIGRRVYPFIMHLHMVEKTLFISRKEKNNRMMVLGSTNSGYGHNFEKACTEADGDVVGSSSHHRVVKYNMGGLNCVVRFEVDAYYDGDEDGVCAHDFDHEGNALAETLDLLTLKEIDSHSTKGITSNASTNAVRKGAVLPSSQMAEIKTRKATGGTARSTHYLPQLWFGRTPYLFIGRNTNDIFHEIVKMHAGSKFTEWEKENQEGLRKLVGILKELKEVVSKVESSAAVLMYEKKKDEPMKILEMKKPTSVLPEEIRRKYWSL
ncbi:hypothetical protein DL764_000844 [Monosporascus ibericus]|uniref:RAI1-like domain-containing protein n=1 Tax=Monosporascus ibericus TaxID=155417 RepID=A0A4Q4TUD2_9PEZI|nr:hypothetical protein DL764_000844 [Monosporascus ibericus]